MTATCDVPIRTVSPLWSRDFRLYFTARLVSLLGDAMLPVALLYGVVELGYGTTGVGLVLAAQMVPFVAFVLFGGVLADRFTPQRMMVGADAGRFVLQAASATAFAVGHPALWLLMALSALHGVGTAAFQPGLASMVTQVSNDLQRANAVVRVAESMANLGGPALAGVLIAVAGVPVVLAVDSATFAVSGLCLMALRLRPLPKSGTEVSTWRNLVEGWNEFRSRTWMYAVIAGWIVLGITVWGPIRPLATILVADRHGASGLGLMWTAFGAGGVVGGLAGVRFRPVRPLASGATVLLAWAVWPLIMASGSTLPFVCAGAMIGGATIAFWGVMWSTSVQTHIPAGVLNRISAYELAGSLVAFPIGQALAGPVSGAVGTSAALYTSGAVLVAVLLGMLSVPAVRNLGNRPEPTPEPVSESVPEPAR
ncbi:MFS transporter [Catenulispora yoronensis]|uniref:MFS transporter n=1 Tax=Catenulispora yoronensis TaxID=450799 RepID=A0ABP5GKF4_9ACTN